MEIEQNVNQFVAPATSFLRRSALIRKGPLIDWFLADRRICSRPDPDIMMDIDSQKLSSSMHVKTMFVKVKRYYGNDLFANRCFGAAFILAGFLKPGEWRLSMTKFNRFLECYNFFSTNAVNERLRSEA
jgi:hypothetical protein